MALRIRCTMLSSEPCTIQKAARCMEAFSEGDSLPRDGILMSFVSAVAKGLREEEAMRRKNAESELALPVVAERPARVNGVNAGMEACGNGNGNGEQIMGQEAAEKVQAVKERSGVREQQGTKRKRKEVVETELADGGKEEEKLECDKVAGTSTGVKEGEVPAELVKEKQKKKRKGKAGHEGGAVVVDGEVPVDPDLVKGKRKKKRERIAEDKGEA